jgi:protein-S-isoprenylcysteine O-methyltransferase Ste14
MSVWRQLRAIGPLPAVAALLVPALVLLLGDGPRVGFGLSLPLALLPTLAGAALIAPGLMLMHRTICLFARVGKGTLAPWDPTRRLVVLGPYRHVRNPMISGVMSILLGEGVLLGSPQILGWFATFVALNAIFIPLVEEPDLARRFGDEYREYKRNVPRWVPRLRPWTPDV